ncbi:MAG TPA: hypothetical protein VE975_09490 [Actinomycetota bacterium]|nr:hypothetical protein [Actinomycetota bacterium]
MDTPRPAANKSPGRGRKAFADERGVIVSWLLRLALWFLIVAIALFDIGAVAVNYFGLDSRADDIAIAVATDVADGSVSGPTAIQEDAAALAAAASSMSVCGGEQTPSSSDVSAPSERSSPQPQRRARGPAEPPRRVRHGILALTLESKRWAARTS